MANKIVHWELMGPNGEELKDFYADLFGWEAQTPEGFDNYHMVSEDSAGIGGAVGQGNEHMPQYQTIYVEVDDIDKYLTKVGERGGTTAVPRTVIPDMVTFALFTDPAGNLVGLVESDQPS